MQRRANLPSRFQPSNLALRLAGALFTKGHAINGELGFRLTKCADCHSDCNRRSGLFVLWKALNVNIVFHLNGCHLYVIPQILALAAPRWPYSASFQTAPGALRQPVPPIL
jgi:hypothetical protein